MPAPELFKNSNESLVATSPVIEPAAESAKASLRKSLAGSMLKMVDLFPRLDHAVNGMIDKAEFRQAVAALGLTANDAVCDSIFDEYDKDADGSIEYTGMCAAKLRDLHAPGSRDGPLPSVGRWRYIRRDEFRRGVRRVGFEGRQRDMDTLLPS